MNDKYIYILLPYEYYDIFDELKELKIQYYPSFTTDNIGHPRYKLIFKDKEHYNLFQLLFDK